MSWDFPSHHDHLAPEQHMRCQEVLTRRDGSTYICGLPWTSAVHPPDQYRHWCPALEAGGDCMHFEEPTDD